MKKINVILFCVVIVSVLCGVSAHAQTGSYTKTILMQSPNIAGGVAVDSAGNIYVTASTEIIKLDSAGNIIKRWPIPSTITGVGHITIDAQNNVYVTSGGVCEITGNGPYVNGVGTTYTPSMSLGVVKFDSNGNQLLTVQAKGSAVEDVAVDSQGNIYMAESGSQSCGDYSEGYIRKYNSQGSFISEWQLHLLDKDKYVDQSGLNGGVEQEHAAGIQLAIDKQGHIWAGVWMATQTNIDWVQEYSTSGSLITEWGNFVESQIPGIATDAQGNVYVAMRGGVDGSQSIKIYNPAGTLSNEIKDSTFSFLNSSDIAVDSSGNIYVANTNTGNGGPNNALMKFAPSGSGTVTSTTTIATTTTTACSYYYWFDSNDSNRQCAYSLFCNASMFQSFKGYDTMAKCSAALSTSFMTNTATSSVTNTTTTVTTNNTTSNSSQTSILQAINALIAQLQSLISQAQSQGITVPASTLQFLANTNSATPTKLSFSFNFANNMGVGTVSSDVAMLQRVLNELGFTVAASGEGSSENEGTTFGPATQSALMRYQQSVGLPAFGYLGPLTRVRLNSLSQ